MYDLKIFYLFKGCLCTFLMVLLRYKTFYFSWCWVFFSFDVFINMFWNWYLWETPHIINKNSISFFILNYCFVDNVIHLYFSQERKAESRLLQLKERKEKKREKRKKRNRKGSRKKMKKTNLRRIQNYQRMKMKRKMMKMVRN